MKSVVKIDLSDKVYGGRIYENQIVELLADKIDFQRIYLLKYHIKIFNIPRIIWLFIKYRYFFKGTLLLTNQTTWLAGRRANNIVIVHHIDTPHPRSLSQFYQYFCDKALFYNCKLYNRVVAVASYWKAELEKNGFENVSIIYNSFDPSIYQFSEHDIDDFKTKYNLCDKPIIYLGNCLKKKGIIQTYQALKDIDAYFVTSGNKDVELPTTHLSLSYKEYRMLLEASDVVITMSQFLEGWNRVAHEAVLAGTAVVGNGSGGMEELLQIANQTICKSYEQLNAEVSLILKNKVKADPKRLSQFNLDYFRSAWLSIFQN